MTNVPAVLFYFVAALASFSAAWVLVLRSRLATAVADVGYWRANSELWRAKLAHANELLRQREQVDRDASKRQTGAM